jgi:hypothetical protein
MTAARDYLKLALHCESEAAKARDKFSRYQLLSLAESYRTLAESKAVLDRSAKALETIDMRRRGQRRAGSYGSFKVRWDQEAKAYRALADKLVPCPERDALLEKARQAETASSM